MQVTAEVQGNVLELKLAGELDHHAAKQVMGELERQIEEHLPKKLILNLAQMQFMDSSGIAVFMRAYRRMGELDGEVTVQNVPGQAEKVIQAANLRRLITFC